MTFSQLGDLGQIVHLSRALPVFPSAHESWWGRERLLSKLPALLSYCRHPLSSIITANNISRAHNSCLTVKHVSDLGERSRQALNCPKD